MSKCDALFFGTDDAGEVVLTPSPFKEALKVIPVEVGYAKHNMRLSQEVRDAYFEWKESKEGKKGNSFFWYYQSKIVCKAVVAPDA